MPKTLIRIKPATEAAKVNGLHEALEFLLERKIILPRDDARRARLLVALSQDRSGTAYRKAAQEIVKSFQNERDIRSSGAVDRATADALNAFLPRAVGTGRPTLAFSAVPTRNEIGNLHEALGKLRLKVSPEELTRRTIGVTTVAAIQTFQESHGLSANGEVNSDTIDRIRAEVDHRYFATNKNRVAQLHELFGRLGYSIDKSEAGARIFGPTSKAALNHFKGASGLQADGQLDDALVAGLRSAALAQQLSSKTQIGYLQRKILRATRIAKLEGAIDPSEIKRKKLGPTTKALIKAFQTKYDLETTGAIDVPTMEKLESVAASRAMSIRKVKVRTAQGLIKVGGALRLNMTNKNVPSLQKALAFIGQPIDVTEMKAGSFGRTTREAVINFQKANWLPVTGHADGKTLRSINNSIASANPAVNTAFPYRVRGSVRDEVWQGRRGVLVQVWEKQVRSDGKMLAERMTLENGFFDVPYSAPIDTNTGRIKQVFHLEIRFVGQNSTPLGTKVLFNPTQIAWANFTQGNQPYRGASQYELRMAAVAEVLSGVSIADIQETDTLHEVTELALNAGLSQDDVMRLVLANRTALKLGDGTVTAPVLYAFIAQNLPPPLPGDLLTATHEWELIEQIVEQTIMGIVFMEPSLQDAALVNAMKENYIPIAVSRTRELILVALAALSQTFALEKPLLSGNGTLRALLQESSVPALNYGAVAQTFAKSQQLGSDFWGELASRPADFGGANAVRELRAVAEIGQVTKNFTPMIKAVKLKIDNPFDEQLRSPRDMAKLTPAEWNEIITSNGGAVPQGTDGEHDVDKVAVYASTLANQSARLFPDVALVAEVARSHDHSLQNIVAIQKLVDDNPDLNLRTDNLDNFVVARNAGLGEDVMIEARALQRVHRLAPASTIARALLDEHIHHSAQIMALGKERFVKKLETRGVERKAALTVYGYAEFQYAHVLMRLGEFRNELHSANPTALSGRQITLNEQQELLGAIPNLETLFGTLDYCDCEHCQSVYGPAAYLADVLRFLDTHPAETPGRTVRDVLFDRRPDIGNIKLNCDNAETSLPYIDIVCEILENAVEAPASSGNFSFQTQLTAEELRAYPENQRKAAYDELRNAKFPLAGAFDLWQEETRVFLDHLGVERHILMRALQTGAGTAKVPSDASIAGEFFGLSSQDTKLVITAAATHPEQAVFFGFDTSRAKIPVLEFLQNTGLTYVELLDLLSVRWVNPDGDPNPIQIERPADSAGLDRQSLLNVTVERFDRIHRLVRLWRHTDMALWEIDILLRHSGGGQALDGTALDRICRIQELRARLSLTGDMASALFATLNTETRPRPGEPAKRVRSLYDALFQNTAITNPVDPNFVLPLPGTEDLENHSATLLAALAVDEESLATLIGLTNGRLTLENLSTLVRHAWLARAIGLSVEDTLTVINLLADDVGSPFASPDKTLDMIDRIDWIRGSGFAIAELDYLLNRRPDSPYGLRDEVIVEHIGTLRETLRTGAADQADGSVVSHVATIFALSTEQAKLLTEKLNLDGPLLAHFKDPALLERDASGNYIEATDAKYPKVFNAYRLLHKTALIVVRAAIPPVQLEWLMTKFSAAGSLDWSALPVKAALAVPTTAWFALSRWLGMFASFPKPEGATLDAIFTHAADPATTLEAVRSEVAALTGWATEDLEKFDGGDKIGYSRIATFVDLAERFRIIRRYGVSATAAFVWANRDDDAAQFATAQQTRQAAKAKYDPATWLAKLAPLQDVLREKKRDALCKHLIQTASRTQSPTITVGSKTFINRKRWGDTNDLLGFFLIDVEMGALQLSSRIKQAISSTQMFVQRAFLNLEQPFVEVSRAEQDDSVSLNSWRQWRWMKSYRIWEANRKVFLYPENWIEPELRDDKSPFFLEFENALMQSEITADNAEAAFTEYLEKANQVSRLDIAGVYHEIDDDNPYDNLPPNINVMHVIGRTRSDPALYFYRTFNVNYSTWTPWEKIDLDITGDHIAPVVFNRKLHLFWLLFTTKPQKVRKVPPAQQTAAPSDPPEPPEQLEIQLAWSVRKDGGWSSRKVSPHKLVHPWPRPTSSYNFKPRYKARENQLWLDIYISTSVKFNNATFYDPYVHKFSRLTGTAFDEAGRPWHSSSFIFDGHVIDLRLKPLSGQFHIFETPGINPVDLTQANSHYYVWKSFGGDDAKLNLIHGPYETGPRLVLPAGMHFEHTRLANNVYVSNPNSLNVIESSATRAILNAAKSPFQLVFSQDHVQFDAASGGKSPFFYQDKARSFFVKSDWETVSINYSVVTRLKYMFLPFYHPYTALYLREINRSGPDGLFTRRIQSSPQTYFPVNSFVFESQYQPTPGISVADVTAQTDIVDFTRGGAFSLYNWEIFFHMPFMVACKLRQNQRFEEAMRWFHYIFDPTSTEALSVPQRYWVTKPFFDQTSEDYRKQRIEELLQNITANLDQVREWKNNPFKPHLIARHRPVAYQKVVLMKYVDNLIAWGDQLFRQDTIEAINEATTLYILAYEIMGRRPAKVPDLTHADKSYNELIEDEELDPFGNKRVEVLMENFVDQPKFVIRNDDTSEPLPALDVLYFCIPPNDRLMEYWTTIEDRLFKIRHSMNISGAVRQLPLFEPPIDPAVLVKAVAAGVDIGSILLDLAVPQSQYRFPTLVAKAVEICNELRGLGEKVLAAMEKRDAEALSLLRAGHETIMLQKMKDVRKQQIEEAENALETTSKGVDVLEESIGYFGGIPRMNAWEDLGTLAHGLGIVSEIVATVISTFAGAAHLIPDIQAGAAGIGGSPTVTLKIGGQQFGSSSANFAALFQGLSSILHQGGQMLEAQGSYTRRHEENLHQIRAAQKQLAQLQTQIEGARLRLAITETELLNAETQIELSQSVEEYMRSKYSNGQLYDWMLSQLATVYFQAYQMAYDMAKRAQKCFQVELGRPTASFIQFGYWDSLKKGLLAGDRLLNDIRRMEIAYLDENKRELELVKHVSLAQVAPLALVILKQTGRCSMQLPEWLFDLDYPGHYYRRIKTVSLTIPSVVGPYTGINCTLSLTRNVVRVREDLGGGYGDALLAPDDRFTSSVVPISMIATSHGQNDAGMFELNFNDTRYLPFEMAGAVSEWDISLPKKNNQFDFAAISDVILHVRYTARSGGIPLRDAASSNAEAAIPAKGAQLISINHEFSAAWARFFTPSAGQDQQIAFTLGPDNIPFLAVARAALAGKTIKVTRVDLVAETTHSGGFDARLEVPDGGGPTNELMARDPAFGGMPHLQKAIVPARRLFGDWKVSIKKDNVANFRSLTPEDFPNAYLVLQYTIA